MIRQDHAPPRAAQSFVGRRGHHVGVRQRTGVDAASDQAREMRHVDHKIGVHFIGDGTEASKIDDPRIGRTAGDNQLRTMLQGQGLNRVIVNDRILAADPVLHRVKPFTGLVRRRAVGEVTAGVQGHPENCVTWFQQGQKDGLVGLGAGMRLHIGVGAIIQGAHPLNR